MMRRAMQAICALALLGAAPPAHQFAEGQVWEYRTRPADAGSLLKIQKIERVPAFAQFGPVFHVTVIGVHLGKPRGPADTMDHAPFSRGALDASVTRLFTAPAVFPDAAEGIAEWHKARGGMFTIPVATAVESVAKTLSKSAKTKR